MKYVSQDNLKQYDTRIKKYISDNLENKFEGVEQKLDKILNLVTK